MAEARAALDRRDARYFHRALPPSEHWRLFPAFRDRAAFVDIETTGLDPDHGHVTTIALYNGREIRTYVWGENLDAFATDIFDYDLLITYNGKCFDLPFLEKYFHIRLDQAHIDLRYPLHSLGYKGGLKGCERMMGLSRGELEGVDGFFAVLLWNDWHHQANRRALDTLLAYNIEDVVNLEPLMVRAFNEKLKATPFAFTEVLPPPPPPPDIPFTPDAATIQRIRRDHYGY